VDQAGVDVRGKRVLDIGANDGLFTIASLLRGAKSVTSINPADVLSRSWPHNLEYAADCWGVRPEVVTGDFMTAPLTPGGYDVILFFGVLYHLENVFDGVRKLKQLLAPGGVVCVETQITTIPHPRPMFEMASDSTPTTVRQFKECVETCGNSNWLLPNDAALVSMADTFGFDISFPPPAQNEYERSPGLEYRRVCHFRPRG
jgi:SAM-dependent methyltransferase